MADDRAPAAPAPEPDRTPRPNRILAEPATPGRCAEDYASGANVRDTCAKQTRRR